MASKASVSVRLTHCTGTGHVGKASRDKGARGEREVVALLPGATRIARTGYDGPDVEWLGYLCEVKRRREAWLFDYQQLRDAPILFKRADRQPWLVTMELDTLLDILEEHGGTLPNT